MANSVADTWLEEGIAAARDGRAEQARAALLRVVAADGHNLQAWYWLSRVVEAPEDRQICLENVLALDPAHTVIQAELADLRREMDQARAAEPRPEMALADRLPQTGREEWFAGAALEPLACPYCAAPGEAAARRCPTCDGELLIREPRRAGHSAWSLGLVLAWVLLANGLWLLLAGSYLVALLSARLAASPGATGTLSTLAELLGREGNLPLAGTPPLAPVLLLGGAALVGSLLVAWGLYQRLRAFYWLSVGLVSLAPLAAIYQVAMAEAPPWPALLVEGVLFLFFLTFAFMAYEEYQWVERRLSADLDRDVDSPSALYARGREHAGQGRWAKAANHWSRAVVLSPGHAEYRLSLATAYLHLGRPERAAEHLQAAQRIEPDNPRI